MAQRRKRTLVGDKAVRKWPKDFTASDLHQRFLQIFALGNERAYEPMSLRAELQVAQEFMQRATNYMILEGIIRAVREGVQSFEAVRDYIPRNSSEPDELYELKWLIDEIDDERARELYNWLLYSLNAWYVSRSQVMRDPRMQEIREAITRLYETR